MTHSAFEILKPPHPFRHSGGDSNPRIFLAGSIDMGSAIDWQKEIEDALRPYPVTIFNPRRDDFDASLVQDISNPPFFEQVNWELDHLDISDIIVFYFDPNGKAPITLLELGLWIGRKPIVVCCPDGYWRKGNVQIICDRLDVELFETKGDLIKELLDIVDDYT